MNLAERVKRWLALFPDEKPDEWEPREPAYIPDKLTFEPTPEEILQMSFQEQATFVQTAKMFAGCKEDDWGNRARIRACYLINEAYKKTEEKEMLHGKNQSG